MYEVFHALDMAYLLSSTTRRIEMIGEITNKLDEDWRAFRSRKGEEDVSIYPDLPHYFFPVEDFREPMERERG